MRKDNVEKLFTYGGSAILAGVAIYLNKDNKNLKIKYKKTREELLTLKEDLEYFILGLKKVHKKYLLMGDNLRAHVKSLSEDAPELGELKMDYFLERFPERDIQFLTREMLMTKISGLVDAFVLNKWSYFPKSEKKKIPKSFLSNNKNLDIYSRNDISLVLSKLKIHKRLRAVDQEFILNLFDNFKYPVLVNGKILDYSDKDINFYFTYMINMILEQS